MASESAGSASATRLALRQIMQEQADLEAEERASEAILLRVRVARSRAEELMGQDRPTYPDIATAFALLARADELLEQVVRGHASVLRAIARDAAATEAEIRRMGQALPVPRRSPAGPRRRRK